MKGKIMDIVIGATSPVKMPKPKDVTGSGNVVEARILNVRSPRRRHGKSPDGNPERRKNNIPDPASSRVMVLLIPDGDSIPKDIESGKYRVVMRFVPRKK